jgi:preprotein translocase subunit SecD
MLAHVLNTIILIVALSYLGAALARPGSAGAVLAIAMAVDSNILIFERIREELRAGKAVMAAVHAGFKKAIVDTQLTTVASRAFLFIFGTSPVKGFALTLVIGLIANLITSVFVLRAIFNFDLSRKHR